ncbi:hypothetical protein [Actinocrispum wychmicini]|nr:hypothetical protein [Actinocrispum wychmicini]
MAGGPAPWGGGPSPLAAPPRPRANAAAAATAGILALITAGMLVWFALYNVDIAGQPDVGWSSLEVQNVLGGVIGAVLLVVAAGFTFARKIPGAWTLCVVCVLFTVVDFVSPLLRGADFDAHVKFLFGFARSNGVAIGLSIIFGVLTAIMAAVAGSTKSYGPTTATPYRP